MNFNMSIFFSSKLNMLASRVNLVDARVDALQLGSVTTSTRLSTLEHQFMALPARYVERDTVSSVAKIVAADTQIELAAMQKRIDALEEKLALLVAQAHMEFKPVTAKWAIDAAETSGQ
jgi:hypothetical protein